MKGDRDRVGGTSLRELNIADESCEPNYRLVDFRQVAAPAITRHKYEGEGDQMPSIGNLKVGAASNPTLALGSPESAPRVRNQTVAVCHDSFTQNGGAERVALDIASAFPGAKVYSTLLDIDATNPMAHEFNIVAKRTTSSQRGDRLFSSQTGKVVWESLRIKIDSADVLIVSTSGWAHHFGFNGPRIIYFHTPARWLYAPNDYFQDRRKAFQALWREVAPIGRWLDRRSISRFDTVIANSRAVAERIFLAYGVEAEVIHPPVHVLRADSLPPFNLESKSYFVTVGRQRGYKHTQNVIECFKKMPGLNLVVVGCTKAYRREGNITFLPRVTDSELGGVYRHARGLISLSHEDFGLTPVEAHAQGTPSILLRRGGFLETGIEGVNTLFVDRVNSDELALKVSDFQSSDWDEHRIRETALRYGLEAFRGKMQSLVEEVGIQ